MFRIFLLLAIFVSVACDEQTRVVGASPSVLRTATTAGPPTSSAATPAPSATASRAASASPAPSATGSPRPSPSTTALPTVAVPSPSPTPATGDATLGSCGEEGGARPATPGPAVPVVFSNQSGSTLEYLSLDAQGRRVLARSLGTGSYTQNAHVGDVWIVSRGGTCVALYRVTAAALLISQSARQSVIPLYAIAGIISDARGNALAGQTVFIWQPEETACSVLGGSESPGYVVSSTTGPEGRYLMYVSPGSYKIRVRATPGYGSQWWSGKPAG